MNNWVKVSLSYLPIFNTLSFQQILSYTLLLESILGYLFNTLLDRFAMVFIIVSYLGNVLSWRIWNYYSESGWFYYSCTEISEIILLVKTSSNSPSDECLGTEMISCILKWNSCSCCSVIIITKNKAFWTFLCSWGWKLLIKWRNFRNYLYP